MREDRERVRDSKRVPGRRKMQSGYVVAGESDSVFAIARCYTGPLRRGSRIEALEEEIENHWRYSPVACKTC